MLRKYMDSYLRYNLYIDNMSKCDIPNIQANVVNNIKRRINNDSLVLNMGEFASEINQNYKRAINQIIFNKYIMTNSSIILQKPISLPTV